MSTENRANYKPEKVEGYVDHLAAATIGGFAGSRQLMRNWTLINPAMNSPCKKRSRKFHMRALKLRPATDNFIC